MTAKVDSRSKILGSMVGSALGDAIGEIVLYKAARGFIAAADIHLSVSSADLLELAKEMEELKYTDDTAMAIGLAESLIARGRIDQKHVGDRFRINCDKEPWRGYGNGPPAIFLLVEKKALPYPEAARKVGEALYGGMGSYGNGAAMRIAPVALFFHDDPELYSHVEASAILTNSHPIAVDGAATLARAIAKAFELSPSDPFDRQSFCRELAGFARTPEIIARLEMVATCLSNGMPASEAADRLGRGVAAHESVPFAIYSFLKESTSFVDCLLCAVTNGGDCDTLGAMACAISGAYLGFDVIPQEWVRKLENREYIKQLADWLFAKKAGVRNKMRGKLAAIKRWNREAEQFDQGVLEELEDQVPEEPAIAKGERELPEDPC
jgi:poly(ADP-ribose) glycohydrolase ARH3